MNTYTKILTLGLDIVVLYAKHIVSNIVNALKMETDISDVLPEIFYIQGPSQWR